MEELEPCALLVGISNGATPVENSTAVPQKLDVELPFDPQFYFWMYTQKN